MTDSHGTRRAEHDAALAPGHPRTSRACGRDRRAPGVRGGGPENRSGDRSRRLPAPSPRLRSRTRVVRVDGHHGGHERRSPCTHGQQAQTGGAVDKPSPEESPSLPVDYTVTLASADSPPMPAHIGPKAYRACSTTSSWNCARSISTRTRPVRGTPDRPCRTAAYRAPVRGARRRRNAPSTGTVGHLAALGNEAGGSKACCHSAKHVSFRAGSPTGMAGTFCNARRRTSAKP